MPNKPDQSTEHEHQVPNHSAVVFKSALTAAELKAGTEYDPDGAEEFVALIRALRKEGSRPVDL